MDVSLLVITLLTAAAVTVAEDCDLAGIKPLFADENLVTCSEDSGFSLVPSSSSSPGKLPAESIRKLCASDACTRMLATLKGLGLGNCDLLGVKLETDLLNPVQAACVSESSPAVTTASRGSGSGSTAGSMVAAAVESTSVATKPPIVEVDSLENVSLAGTTSNPPISSLTKPPATPVASKTPAPTTSSASTPSITMSASVAAAVVVGTAIIHFFL